MFRGQPQRLSGFFYHSVTIDAGRPNHGGSL
jgi:hypothetical protein